MEIIQYLLLFFLIMCALAVAMTENVRKSVFLFTGFSLIASILWAILQAPDLALTEAAVGAGASTVLFLVALRNIDEIGGEDQTDDEKQ